MENLQQIVLQETTVSYIRALAQYGSGFIPEQQIEIIYEELTQGEKDIWDSFVTMIKTKQ